MFWKTLGRLVLVPMAFLLAALATGFVFFTLGLERLTHAVSGQEGPELVEQGFDILERGWLIASGATLLPALLVVIVGEVARVRSWVYYVLGGGAAMTAIPLLARMDVASLSSGTSGGVWQVFATAGFAGGFLYWLIAGRSA